MNEWKEGLHKVWYYWKTETGLVIGQVNSIAHTEIHIAKVISECGEEIYLGQYVSSDFARRAVENYWNIQERTLPHY